MKQVVRASVALHCIRVGIASSVAAGLVVGGAAEAASNQGLGIPYYLPKTVPVITGTFVLTACDVNGGSVNMKSSFALSTEAKADTGRRPYWFYPEDIASGRVARDFTLTTDANGVLASLASTDEDRTGAIITNVVKSVLAVASLGVLGAAPAAAVCTTDAKSAVLRADAIRKALADLRNSGQIGGDPATKPKDLKEQEDALIAELADLTTNVLTIKVVSRLSPTLGTNGTGAVTGSAADRKAFAKWFGSSNSQQVDAALSSNKFPTLKFSSLPAEQLRASAVSCKRELVVPQPVMTTFALEGGDPDEAIIAPVQQFGAPATLCLDVGLFKKRTVNLTWDPYGRLTKLAYTRNASVEAATGVVADALGQGAQYKKDHPATTEQQRISAEVDAKEVQIRSINADRCLATLAAGGSCVAGK